MATKSVACFVLILSIISSAFTCDYHPSVWCSSLKIASKCKVVDQCRNFVWKSNNVGDDDHYWSSAKPVNIGLYYEVLCSCCKNFILQQLLPTYKAIPEIFEIDFVPYGNTKETFVDGRWEFTCQHGTEECLGNMIHTCALYLNPINMTIPFIGCMESSHEPSMKFSGRKCAKKHGLNFEDIMTCAVSDQGNQLQHQMALKTQALDPPHEYVAWITVNGVHTENIEKKALDNLLELICETYEGQKPLACQKKSRCLNTF